MSRARALVLAASASLLLGCETVQYQFADDVKVQFSEQEKIASIKAQLGCEGAHPAEEKDDEKKERIKREPKTDLGKKWLARACEIADAFDAAGPVTSWPADKAVWAGERICRPEISRVVGDEKTAPDAIDESAFARMGRVEISKGEAAKLWADGPDVPKDRLLGYKMLFTDVTFKVTKDKLEAIDEFFATLAKGDAADVESLRKDEKGDERKGTDAIAALVAAKNVPGILVKSEGNSTLGYPVLRSPREIQVQSAIHYLRQRGDKLLIASPMIGASQPSACVAELTLQK